jgi:hypothetical protein
MQNEDVESFHGRLRDECLNAHWFRTLNDVRSTLASWRADGANGFRDSVPGSANGTRTSSVPPIEYRQGPVSTAANGSLSFAEQMRLDEYKREGGDGSGNLGEGQSAERGN